ncbi:MAG: GNAT family N-acetyltransferase, partial [Gemmatimonadetes bacterium]|nr:GNAT family N-acetyltransferase [Gemmatimonadota bacterium]
MGRFAGCRVTHSSAWLRSLEASGIGTALQLVFERGGEVVGALPGLVVAFGPLRLFGSPLPGWQTVSMGPVYDPSRVTTSDLVRAAVPYLESVHGVRHVEMISSTLDEMEMRACGFRGEEMPSYCGVLHPGAEERTMRALKDSARRNIRRAVRLGLTVRFTADDAFVDEHYAQITEVFARGGNVVPFPKRRLRALVEHMREDGQLLAATVYLPDGRTPIATGTFTADGRELVLWMWAHYTRYRWYRPTELMTWLVMQRAMAAGCERFDLMGRGDFKAVFGAELDGSKRRWVYSRLAWLTWVRDLAEKGFRWQQAIRGRAARRALERSGA